MQCSDTWLGDIEVYWLTFLETLTDTFRFTIDTIENVMTLLDPFRPRP